MEVYKRQVPSPIAKPLHLAASAHRAEQPATVLYLALEEEEYACGLPLS